MLKSCLSIGATIVFDSINVQFFISEIKIYIYILYVNNAYIFIMYVEYVVIKYTDSLMKPWEAIIGLSQAPLLRSDTDLILFQPCISVFTSALYLSTINIPLFISSVG